MIKKKVKTHGFSNGNAGDFYIFTAIVKFNIMEKLARKIPYLLNKTYLDKQYEKEKNYIK